MKTKGKLIIFSAPSGSGKTSIVKEILKTDIPFAFSISATSRLARAGEEHGEDYFFLSVEDFKRKIVDGEFIEWEEVYPNQFYGTLFSEVARLQNQGKHVLFDVDVVGGLNIKKQFGAQALAIFIQVPSIFELKKRLQMRGTEDVESFEKRFQKAELELTYAPDFDIIIVNEVLEKAVEDCIKEIQLFIDKS
jgi:guanylate kinase